MNALWTATLAVALAEIGDKTQLLSLVLATRFRAPGPIIAGIAVATLANHALAGWFGAIVAGWIGAAALRWVVGVGFLGMAVWTLFPDAADDVEADGRSALVTTTVAFFIAEMGDKTQLATVGLAAAHPGDTWAVIAGTTLGMMLANVPVVLLGDRIGAVADLQRARFAAAALFAAFGGWVLWAGVPGV